MEIIQVQTGTEEFYKTCNFSKDYSNTVSKMLSVISHRGPDDQRI